MPLTLKNVSAATIVSATLRCLAAATLFVYVAWNSYWLSQQAIPPSLFVALTGLPCPTTGGTRAIRCLVQGDVRESLRFNALAIPLVAMFFLTVASLAYRFQQRRPIVLPGRHLAAWLGLLSVAWVLKLLGSPDYW